MNLTSLVKLAAVSTISAVALTACYVVPLNQYPQGAAGNPSMASAPPTSVVLTAKLYPANDLAAPYGMLTGSVTSHLNGAGEISVLQADELFRGAATRDAANTRSGTANAAGSKGGYMNCTYTMNNTVQGTGTCKFNNGAMYRFHLSA
jgi:hypothetical protein